jgi:multidrug resistance efflux pump
MTLQEREAQRDQAAASLAAAERGPSAQEIAAAEARVDQAAVALENAESRLESMQLYAPFDGTIVGLEINEGEAAVPGQPLLTVADLANLHVETTDLSERDVAGIEVGMAAAVAIEALDLAQQGRVIRIALRPTVAGGDVTYPVHIALDGTPPNLRWGMSAEVSFERSD